MNLKTESGRSMVEMLGTLAIIGVLSIGGIAGYSYGMDKYRANETINDIMLRLFDLKAQSAVGREELSLSGWSKETSTYEFGTPVYTADDLIQLDVGTVEKPIPKQVCEHIFTAMNSYALYIDINGEKSELGATCGQNNVMTFYFEGNDSQMVECNPACDDDEYCDNGLCFKGGRPEQSHLDRCSVDTDCGDLECGKCIDNGYGPEYNYCDWMPHHGRDCTIKTQNDGTCYWGDCLKKGCNDSLPCTGAKEYCSSFNISSDSEAFPNGSFGVCVTPNFVRHEFNGTVYYISNLDITWWDASAACKALGKQMLRVEDFTQEISEWLQGVIYHARTWTSTRSSSTGNFYAVSPFYGINPSYGDASFSPSHSEGTLALCR